MLVVKGRCCPTRCADCPRTGQVDVMDDPAFFAPFVPFFDPRGGRPSTPMKSICSCL